MQEVEYFKLVVMVLANGHFHKPDEQMLSHLFLRLEGAADTGQGIEQQ